MPGARKVTFERHEVLVRRHLNDDIVVATVVDAVEHGKTTVKEVQRACRIREVSVGTGMVATDVIWCVKSVMDGDIPTLAQAMDVRMAFRRENMTSMESQVSRLLIRKPREVADYIHAVDPKGAVFKMPVELRKTILTVLQTDVHLDYTDYMGQAPDVVTFHIFKALSNSARIDRGVRCTVSIGEHPFLLRAERTDVEALRDGAQPTTMPIRVREWLDVPMSIPEIDAATQRQLFELPLPGVWAQSTRYPGLHVRPTGGRKG